MRILVFGAGAIGSLLGHRLSHAGHEVTLVGRPAYVRAVQAHGLLLEEPSPARRGRAVDPSQERSLALHGRAVHPGQQGDPALHGRAVYPSQQRDPALHGRAVHPGQQRDPALHGRAVYPSQERSLALYGRTVYPKAVERIADIPARQRTWDLILLTVKAYDTQEAAHALAPYVSPDAPLLIVQNGVGGEELVLQVLNQATIISGVITLVVSVLAPGHVRLDTARGGLSLAPTRENQRVDSWAELFAGAGLKTATCRDYRAQKWSKLLLNILANAIPAILDMPPGAIFAEPSLFDIERAAFREALAVMSALWLKPVSLPGYPVPLLAWAMRTLPAPLLRALLGRLVASGRGEKKPSLQIDLARGRERSEVLYLNGAVVTYAGRVGLDAPVNKVLLSTLLSIATGRLAWDEFEGQPQKLVALIH